MEEESTLPYLNSEQNHLQNFHRSRIALMEEDSMLQSQAMKITCKNFHLARIS